MPSYGEFIGVRGSPYLVPIAISSAGTKMAVHLGLTGYHFLRYLYFYRMLHRHNAGAISVRVNLSKFRAKEKDLRGIVDPQEAK